MHLRERNIFTTCLLMVLCFAVSALSQPQPVPRLVERPLDNASYVQLAKEWKAYIEKHGESAQALVNLGMAYNYSGQGEAALIAARRAVEIDPDYPKALFLLGGILSVRIEDMEGALKLLERGIKIAPDNEYGLTTLIAANMKMGELEKSDKVLKTVFDQKIIARPLQDFAYNMLVGLPRGAVLITNGDNDTFPPLALQAGMNFRNDVAVINRNLFNLKDYVEAIFKRYPAIKTAGKIEPEGDLSLSGTLLKRIIDERKAPIYFASTVAIHQLGFDPTLTTEGLNRRASGKGLTVEESARLFFDTYRMDSATDWNFAFDLVPGTTQILQNYVSCMIDLAQQDGVSVDTRKRLLDEALVIATFHDMDRLTDIIEAYKKKWKTN